MGGITYLDFDLQIQRTDGGYRVVVNSPAGQTSADLTPPFSDLELENFLLKIGRPRRGGRRADTPEVDAVKKFGARLYAAVFRDEVMGCWRASLDEAARRESGLRVRLHLVSAPELADLPWEYLYNPSRNQFLALSKDTPVVRYLDLPERIRPLEVQPPLRVLVMISSPNNFPKLDVEREWGNLSTAVGERVKTHLLQLERLPRATLGALQHCLRQDEFHILHFIGHGNFDPTTQDGNLILEDEEGRGRPVSGQDLGVLLHDHKPMRLVVLNACEGARSSRTDPFAGTAQSLVQQGLPAIIAMQFEISDQAAIRFAQEFYAAVSDGYPVDAALAESRKAIFTDGYGPEWGTPVLYLRAPDGLIFRVQRPAAPPPPPPPPARPDPDFLERKPLGPAQRPPEPAPPPAEHALAASATPGTAVHLPSPMPDAGLGPIPASLPPGGSSEKGLETPVLEPAVEAPTQPPVERLPEPAPSQPGPARPSVSPRLKGGGQTQQPSTGFFPGTERKRIWKHRLARPVGYLALIAVLSVAGIWVYFHFSKSDSGQGVTEPQITQNAPGPAMPLPHAVEPTPQTEPNNRSSSPSSAETSTGASAGRSTGAPAKQPRSAGHAHKPTASSPTPTPRTSPIHPTPAAPSQPVPVSGSLMDAQLDHRVVPTYPEQAKAAHVQGTVSLEATIGTDGAVTALRLISGPPELVTSATDAVRQWHYRPTKINGKATEVVTTINVVYKLTEPQPCTLGQVSVKEEAARLIVSVPYVYRGTYPVQDVVVMGTALKEDGTEVTRATPTKSTLKENSGTAMFSLERTPSLAGTPQVSKSLKIYMIVKGSNRVLCTETVAYQTKW